MESRLCQGSVLGIVLATLFLFLGRVDGQLCGNGASPLTINPANYQTYVSCTTLNFNSLTITGAPFPAINFTLPNLTTVQRMLYLQNLGTTPDLTFISNLQSVQLRIVIYNNPGLTSLAGLEKITAIGSDGIYIQDNAQLYNISMPNLVSCVGIMFMKFTTTPGPFVGSFPKLEYIGGTTDSNILALYGGAITTFAGWFPRLYRAGLDVRDLPNLLDLDGFNNVSQCSGYHIQQCASLVSLAGLSKCRTMQSIWIGGGLPSLPAVSLPNVTTFTTGLRIDGFDSPLPISFPNLNSTGHLHLRGIPWLTAANFAAAFPVLKYLDDINFHQLNITNLDYIADKLPFTLQHILLSQMPLTSLSFMSNVRVIKGTLGLDTLRDLTSLHGLHNLATLDLYYPLSFYSLDKITNLDALSNLRTIYVSDDSSGSDLEITNMPALKSIRGLCFLRSVRLPANSDFRIQMSAPTSCCQGAQSVLDSRNVTGWNIVPQLELCAGTGCTPAENYTCASWFPPNPPGSSSSSSSTGGQPGGGGDSPPDDTAAIIGGVIGGAVFLLCLVCGLLWFCRRRKDKKQEKTTAQMTDVTTTA